MSVVGTSAECPGPLGQGIGAVPHLPPADACVRRSATTTPLPCACGLVPSGTKRDGWLEGEPVIHPTQPPAIPAPLRPPAGSDARTPCTRRSSSPPHPVPPHSAAQQPPARWPHAGAAAIHTHACLRARRPCVALPAAPQLRTHALPCAQDAACICHACGLDRPPAALHRCVRCRSAITSHTWSLHWIGGWWHHRLWYCWPTRKSIIDGDRHTSCPHILPHAAS